MQDRAAASFFVFRNVSLILSEHHPPSLYSIEKRKAEGATTERTERREEKKINRA
jgi:hypothetical protein